MSANENPVDGSSRRQGERLLVDLDDDLGGDNDGDDRDD
jgi:hypothetical protein